jgi:hypothetical protein
MGIHVHPRQGSAPANAPALVFAPGNTAHDTQVSGYELELRAPDDSIVPYTMVQDPESSEYLIKPDKPLDVGTYRFRYHQLCSYGFPAGYDQTIVSIAAPATLPTEIGTAKVRSPVAEISGNATCLPVKVYTVVDVTMSPEFAAYQALARYRVTFRQQPLAMDAHFQHDRPGELDYGNIQSSATVLYFGINDTCALGQERVQGRLEIAAHIAGATSDPAPLVVDVDVACPTFKYGPPPLCADLDAGTSIPADAATPLDMASPDAFAPSTSALDAAAPTTSSLEPSSSDESGCKCSLSRGHGPVRSSLAWVLGLGLLVLGRRRRG